MLMRQYLECIVNITYMNIVVAVSKKFGPHCLPVSHQYE